MFDHCVPQRLIHGWQDVSVPPAPVHRRPVTDPRWRFGLGNALQNLQRIRHARHSASSSVEVSMPSASHPGTDWTTLPAVHEAVTAGDFGALFRIARTAAGLTLREAGSLAGYSPSTLSRWESGR